jgi:DNA-binding beta-propeller fold protein YncE
VRAFPSASGVRCGTAVTAAELVSIQVSPTNPYVIVGNTQQLTATGLYADASTQDLTATASWSSSNTAAATINSSGLASMLATAGVGSATTISAVVGGVSGQTTLTAKAVAVVDPSGRYVYVLAGNSNAIWQYTIGANGSLTFTSTVGIQSPYSMVIDPSGQYAYVTSISSLAQFTINPDGSLASMSTPTVSVGGNPNGITLDPSGRYVYVTSFTYSFNGNTGNFDFGNSIITRYSVGSDGSLTALSSVAAGVDPTAIVTRASQ